MELVIEFPNMPYIFQSALNWSGFMHGTNAHHRHLSWLLLALTPIWLLTTFIRCSDKKEVYQVPVQLVKCGLLLRTRSATVGWTSWYHTEWTAKSATLACHSKSVDGWKVIIYFIFWKIPKCICIGISWNSGISFQLLFEWQARVECFSVHTVVQSDLHSKFVWGCTTFHFNMERSLRVASWSFHIEVKGSFTLKPSRRKSTVGK